MHALAEAQQPELDRLDLRRLFDEVELPLVEVLCRMERQGVKLDTERLGELAANVADEVAQLEREICELAGEEFTIGSPQQLSRVLFEKLGLSRKRRGKTGFSTDARVLAAIRDEHEIVAKVETWRELSKLKSTYFDALPELISPETGRLHTTFNQAATTTGRLSSTNPNLQNIPIRTALGRKIRSCFVAEQGSKLISADYSQVELRILAHVAGEDVLKQIFERGEDVHAATAAEVLKLAPGEIGPGERSRAKAVNFGIVYGLERPRSVGAAADPARRGRRVHRALSRALPRGARVHRPDDRARRGARLRDDAVRPPSRHPGAPLAQVPDPLPRRAAGGQHGDPGHRRRHHQDRDGALRPAPARARACAPGWC